LTFFAQQNRVVQGLCIAVFPATFAFRYDLLALFYRRFGAVNQQAVFAGLEIGLIPITIPELVRLLRDTVIPPPCRDRPHRQHWSQWRRRHQYRARQAHQRWNAYADITP